MVVVRRKLDMTRVAHLADDGHRIGLAVDDGDRNLGIDGLALQRCADGVRGLARRQPGDPHGAGERNVQGSVAIHDQMRERLLALGTAAGAGRVHGARE